MPTSIRNLAETASRLGGVAEPPLGRSSAKADPPDQVVLSIERMARYTGWRPAYSLDAGIRATLAEMVS